MAGPVPGARAGGWRFGFGLPQHAVPIRQEAPPGGVDYLEWENLENLSLDPSYGSGLWGEYARVLHLGEPGYPTHAARIVFTMKSSEFWVNWNAQMGPYFPPDGYMTQILGSVIAYTIPEAMRVLCTLSATPSDPGWYFSDITDMDITRVDPPTDPENLLAIGWGKFTGTGLPPTDPSLLWAGSDNVDINVDFVALPPVDYNPPHITETYFRGIRMYANWKAETATDMDESGPATATFGLSGEATGKAIWAMNGSGTMSLSAAPVLNVNAVLDGNAPLNLEFLGDPSIGTTYTDSTAWGFLGLNGDNASLVSNLALSSGEGEFTLTGEAQASYTAKLGGTVPLVMLDGTDSTIGLDGSFYTFTSFFLTPSGDLAGLWPMSAGGSLGLSGVGSALSGTFKLAANGSWSLDVDGAIGQMRNVDGATEFSMVENSAALERDVRLDGSSTLALGTWAGITYFRPQPAAPERTFSYATSERTVELGSRERTKTVEQSDRVVEVAPRSRVIQLRQQHEGQ